MRSFGTQSHLTIQKAKALFNAVIQVAGPRFFEIFSRNHTDADLVFFGKKYRYLEIYVNIYVSKQFDFVI